MRLRKDSGGSPGDQTPPQAPEPEGPEELSERMLRRRDEAFGRLVSRLRRRDRSENGSPKKSLSAFLTTAATVVVAVLGVFVDSSILWVLTTGLGALSALLHNLKNKGGTRGKAAEKLGKLGRGGERYQRLLRHLGTSSDVRGGDE